MTQHIRPGFQDPDSYDVGVAISKSKIAGLRTGPVVWLDRYDNELFTSVPVKTTGGIAWYADLELVVHETTRMPQRMEIDSVEALMFLTGLLDKMMRDAGH
jgi:hypothetical protein